MGEGCMESQRCAASIIAHETGSVGAKGNKHSHSEKTSLWGLPGMHTYDINIHIMQRSRVMCSLKGL